MIVFWTSAKSDAIASSFGSFLKAMKPNVPEHKFVPWKEPDENDMHLPELNPGDVLIVAGKKPLSTLQAMKLAPKGRTVEYMREKPLPVGMCTAFVTHDPYLLNTDPSKKQIMEWDLRLALRWQATGSLLPEIGEYKWVGCFTETIQWIEDRYEETGQPVDVSLDTETEGFYPWYPDKDIVTLQVTAQPKTAHVLYLGKFAPPVPYSTTADLLAQVEYLLTSPKVKLRGANLKYDLQWIRVKWGLVCTNFKFDTMLVGSLLDENRSNSLNIHAKVATSMGGYDDAFNDVQDKGQMGSIPPETPLLTYAGGDTDACQRVSDVFREQLLEDPELTQFYITILHPAARAFERLEYRGIHVDVDKYHKLRDDLTVVIDQSFGAAIQLLPYKMQVKYRDKIADQLAEGKSPLLPSIMKEFFFSPHGLNLKPKMYTAKTNEPVMSKAHLKMFGDTPEAMQMLEVMGKGNSAAKTRSTFVDGFLEHLRPDGLLHPTYFLAFGNYEGFEEDDSGTDTGRLSAKGPPFQIIPKKTDWAKRIRECFIAPKGKVILQLDYSQGELRVVACVANEKNMLKAYEAGLDLHAVTGAQLGGVDYQTYLTWKGNEDEALSKLFDDLRQRAKAGNFGLLYGMGANGFMAYAWAQFGLKLTLEEATLIRDLFFETYPGLIGYHDKQRAHVKMQQMVRSPLGRVAHLETIKSWDSEIRSKAERKAINSPIQSTLSDMMCWSISEIDLAYPNDEIATVGMTHDSLMAYVDEDKVELRAAQAAEVMSNLPFEKVGWKPQLKFPADAEAGTTLANLKKLSLAKAA